MKQTYSKKEKLKSTKLIDELFEKGQSVLVYPLRLIYMESSFNDSISIKAAISVSKRNFKKAVDRNRIKRLMREAYRLQKDQYFNNITTQYALMILYIGKEKSTFSEIEFKMKLLLERFMKRLSKE